MSATAISCGQLPLRSEILGHGDLATVQGGMWGPLIRKGIEEVAKAYVVKVVCDTIDAGLNRAWTYWEEIQVEADTEAMAQARHEMRQQYFNKAG